MVDESVQQQWDNAYQRARTVLVELDDGVLDKPTGNPGWTVRNLAAHIATGSSLITMSAARLSLGKGLTPIPMPNWLGAKIGDMFNKRTVKNHAQDGSAEFVSLIDSEHQKAVAAVAEVPAGGWDKRGSIPGVGKMSLTELVSFTAKHYDEHLDVLKQAVGKNGS